MSLFELPTNHINPSEYFPRYLALPTHLARDSDKHYCKCTWKTFPHSKARHCEQDRIRRLHNYEPFTPNPSHNPDLVSCHRHVVCGTPLTSVKGYGYDCGKCFITIPKTSKSAYAIASREDNIYHGTKKEWENFRTNDCQRCHQWPAVDAIGLCVECHLEVYESNKKNAREMAMKERQETFDLLAPVFAEMHALPLFQHPILHYTAAAERRRFDEMILVLVDHSINPRLTYVPDVIEFDPDNWRIYPYLYQTHSLNLEPLRISQIHRQNANAGYPCLSLSLLHNRHTTMTYTTGKEKRT